MFFICRDFPITWWERGKMLTPSGWKYSLNFDKKWEKSYLFHWREDCSLSVLVRNVAVIQVDVLPLYSDNKRKCSLACNKKFFGKKIDIAMLIEWPTGWWFPFVEREIGGCTLTSRVSCCSLSRKAYARLLQRRFWPCWRFTAGMICCPKLCKKANLLI